MFTAFYTSAEMVAFTLTSLAMLSFAAAIVSFLGLSWSNESWRIPVALGGTGCMITAVYYAGAAGLWYGIEAASAGPRYSAWYSVHPLQVAAVFFFVNTQGKVPVGVFWRVILASVLMVFGRWLGDATFFNPTLGALISIAFWLYILGEMYFGAMSQVMRKAERPVQIGYFWMRLLMTVGWAIYPILHFVDKVIGVGQSDGVVVIYSLFDIVNLIIPALIIVAVAGQDRY